MRGRMVSSVVVSVLLLGTVVGDARGAPEGSGHLTPVSGHRAATVPGCGAGELTGFEGDHVLAAHPAGRGRLVAAYAQDGEVSIGVSHSEDGGRTWTASTPSGFTRCDGSNSPFEYAFDAWASVGADGRTYVSAAVATASPIPPDPAGGYGVVVATPPDAGRTWDQPVTVARSIDLLPADKPTVTADPVVPGRAWVTWTEVSIVGGTTVTRISRTDDGGRTWSEPSLHPPAPGKAEFGHELVVLPDGDLFRTFTRFAMQPLVLARTWIGGGSTIVGARSSDGGSTWIETPLADVPEAVLRDPETGEDLALGIPYVVADLAAHGSSLAVAWAEPTANGRVRLLHSSDGARTWTEQVVAQSPAPMFRASVALSDRRLWVTWSDLAWDAPGDDELSTTTVLGSWDGKRWQRRSVGPMHDLRDARQSGASAVPGGDYWGIVDAGPGVVVGMNLPSPLAESPGDLFAWSGPGGPASSQATP